MMEEPNAVLVLIWQFVPLAVLSVLAVLPFYKLFRRAGRSGWWALLGFVPIIGLFILPWMLLAMQPKTADVS